MWILVSAGWNENKTNDDNNECRKPQKIHALSNKTLNNIKINKSVLGACKIERKNTFLNVPRMRSHAFRYSGTCFSRDFSGFAPKNLFKIKRKAYKLLFI